MAYPRPIHVFTKKKNESAVASWSGAPGAATARPGCAVAAPYLRAAPYVGSTYALRWHSHTSDETDTSLFIFNDKDHNDVLSTPYSVVKLGAKVVASRSFGEHTTRRCATVRDGRTSERRDERAMDSDERRKDVRRSDVHPSTISRSFINIFFS